MFCKNCGHDIVEGLVCPNCGMENVEEVVETKEVSIEKNSKIWDVFARVGFGLGIATFIATFATLGFLIFYSVIALVISSLGKKSIEYNRKARTGFKLSLISVILSAIFIVLIAIVAIIVMILTALGIITGAGIIIFILKPF